VKGLSINLATVRQQYGFAAAVDACLAQGITAIAPWRDQVEAIGLDEAADRRAERPAGHGLLPRRNVSRRDSAGLAAAIDDNKRAIDEAAALGADCLVLVVGGLPGASKDIGAARAMVADGIAAICRTPGPPKCRWPSNRCIRCTPPIVPA
jgi:sugar phosphate isomerase/epimerase